MLERLSLLRKKMRARNLQAYLIPSEDAHQSEYIAEWDARRMWISGFSGSAGFAIVTNTKAALWTDGRYFLQAEKQLDLSNWILMKAGISGTPNKETWLNDVLESDNVVGGGNDSRRTLGVDGSVISWEGSIKLKSDLLVHGIELVIETSLPNLIDEVWGSEKPEAKLEAINELKLEYSGEEFTSKLYKLYLWLHSQDSHKDRSVSTIISTLDEVAWLLNLRGSDIECNPLFFAFVLVTLSSDARNADVRSNNDHSEWKDCLDVSFYLWGEERLNIDAKNSIKTQFPKLNILPYMNIYNDLRKNSLFVKLSPSTCNAALAYSIEEGGGIASPITTGHGRSPLNLLKAVKNSTEIKGFRECHIRDSIALCRYFAYLQKTLDAGLVVDEVDGATKLESFRSQGPLFKGLSFATISGSGPNGAIIHYKPEKGSCANITKDLLYLCDSGAQYLDGTTDVTRTVHFGKPTQEEKDAFTRVLMGHIALDSAVFPPGTTGFMLDVLARGALWKEGLDYRHGTGHGVGHYLNVHEGPQSISFHPKSNDTPLLPGMTITNEPGYYLDGRFGIRIENVLMVQVAKVPNNSTFFSFENLTIAPIQTSLINMDILSNHDIKWINEHHKKSWSILAPRLESLGDMETMEWLRLQTKEI